MRITEPKVRIHSPPAVSRQTIRSSAAEPHLPFVMSQHPCRPGKFAGKTVAVPGRCCGRWFDRKL